MYHLYFDVIFANDYKTVAKSTRQGDLYKYMYNIADIAQGDIIIIII